MTNIALAQMPPEQISLREHAATLPIAVANEKLKTTTVKAGQMYKLLEENDGRKWWRKVIIKEVSPPNVYYSNVERLDGTLLNPIHEYDGKWWNLNQLEDFEYNIRRKKAILVKFELKK